MQNEHRVLILAAGGMVMNERGEVLFMFRRGKWDLPKGKLDPGETLEACALREVEEETGVKKLELKKFLLVTEHFYQERGISILKKSHWYLMAARSEEKLVPQTEEDITELRWIGAGDINIVERNTYPAILDVLKTGGFNMGI